MSSELVQVLTAFIGVAGTLAAAIVTQAIARRNERDRRTADDQRRWNDLSFELAHSLLQETDALADRAHTGKAGYWIRSRKRRAALARAGHLHMGDLPDEGVDGLITAGEVAWFRSYETTLSDYAHKFQEINSKLSLIADVEVSEAAARMQVAALELADCCCQFESSLYDSRQRALHEAEGQFRSVVRSYLRRDIEKEPVNNRRLEGILDEINLRRL
ncbi:hypothetical protein [Streptomonospora salina]|uniref:Uncharacterized protein n=1 Tax=Streptomonospora salina TaxID=104205 RepID=A0A841EAS2_9ACTN|nr:hypothetical protein [Streptomonospora salina]MBB6000225.1 hypothetical protein [Streptomonospora salina]